MVMEQHINLSLEELSSEVAHLLETYCLLGGSQDNRISPVPDARTIRYYTTLGLLDRPRMEGRQAKYGKRHLLQVLAIKALQAIGLPLSEVQSRIYGLADAEIEALLVSLSQGKKVAKEPVVRQIVWREVVIEPGLKLMIEDGWSTQNLDLIKEKMAAALAALNNAPNGGNGGKTHEHRD